MPTHRDPQYLHQRLADNVRKRRRTLGISQEQLSERSGLHRTYIAHIEGATRNPSLATLEALATGLGCAALELIADTDL